MASFLCGYFFIYKIEIIYLNKTYFIRLATITIIIYFTNFLFAVFFYSGLQFSQISFLCLWHHIHI